MANSVGLIADVEASVPLGPPHEVNALAPDGVLGGDAGRVALPAVPVA